MTDDGSWEQRHGQDMAGTVIFITGVALGGAVPQQGHADRLTRLRETEREATAGNLVEAEIAAFGWYGYLPGIVRALLSAEGKVDSVHPLG